MEHDGTGTPIGAVMKFDTGTLEQYFFWMDDHLW